MSHKKILMIEDEAVQSLLLELQLKEIGFDFVSARTGEEGLAKALEEKPDVILLDMILPGMTGVEVCMRLQESPRTRRIPVLLVTASQMRGLEERCRKLGVRGLLTKPYEFSELLEKLQPFLPSQEAVVSA